MLDKHPKSRRAGCKRWCGRGPPGRAIALWGNLLVVEGLSAPSDIARGAGSVDWRSFGKIRISRAEWRLLAFVMLLSWFGLALASGLW